ncbi:MAG: NADP-dependent phosphogluconate dehydrogenase [Pyrinomonadaceae bacterium]|nr:NADP-dependent phosphogluconate dehydrogenase [Pyrinomonadaceae bacterium]MCX7640535.1 NADP-dependent phosphogluconate dehydrogenase [Pyrinomonadaceae bacterium]MDW8303884.1 NADP-dependent phosphogluconate dehydrogenase [Acidobacteriota bacterium]
MKSEVGIIGLGAIGGAFLTNISEKGFACIGYDKETSRYGRLRQRAKGAEFAVSLDEFFERLEKPRRVIMFLPHDKVDEAVESLVSYLRESDVLIDAGNSHFLQTEKRISFFNARGLEFAGVGVSGGIEGALKGASIMFGGKEETYRLFFEIFEASSAKFNGESCQALVGKGASGHLVKMVHNGIEYGLMELIAEVYQILRKAYGFSNSEIANIFAVWNKGELNSFLIEITSKILHKKDNETGQDLIDVISDAADQKGTGKWTVKTAVDSNVAIPTIDAAVSMRIISSLRKQRERLASVFNKTKAEGASNLQIEALEKALLLGFIATYEQGFSLIRAVSRQKGYDCDLAKIAKIWRAGCIIRSGLLNKICRVFEDESNEIFISRLFLEQVKEAYNDLKRVCVFALERGYPLMALTASFNYLNAISSLRLPTNLIQAQRDFFGNHGYERIDQKGIFHTLW